MQHVARYGELYPCFPAQGTAARCTACASTALDALPRSRSPAYSRVHYVKRTSSSHHPETKPTTSTKSSNPSHGVMKSCSCTRPSLLQPCGLLIISLAPAGLGAGR
ncbi:hypothetical protein MHYP_G00229850 [Metynnis hypsauchen]